MSKMYALLAGLCLSCAAANPPPVAVAPEPVAVAPQPPFHPITPILSAFSGDNWSFNLPRADWVKVDFHNPETMIALHNADGSKKVLLIERESALTNAEFANYFHASFLGAEFKILGVNPLIMLNDKQFILVVATKDGMILNAFFTKVGGINVGFMCGIINHSSDLFCFDAAESLQLK